MSYDESEWFNGPGGGTPKNAARFNHMDAGIKEASDRLDAIEIGITTTVVSNSYTLVIGDISKAVESTSATAINITVPPNSTVAFPVGTVIEVAQIGVGQITLVPGASVTLRSAGSALKTRVQYSTLSIRKRATNEWVVAGDVTT